MYGNLSDYLLGNCYSLGLYFPISCQFSFIPSRLFLSETFVHVPPFPGQCLLLPFLYFTDQNETDSVNYY